VADEVLITVVVTSIVHLPDESTTYIHCNLVES
jgi:hypothetical protein